MSAFDIIILLVVVVSILHGLRKGLIVQAGAVAAIIVGILLCRLFGDALTARFVAPDVDPGTLYVTSVFANVIVFAVGYLVTRLFAHVVHKVVESIHLGFIDRIGGAVFSLFEWLFILSLLLNVWQALRPQDNIAGYADRLSGKPVEIVMNFAPAIIGSPQAQELFQELK